MVTKATRQSYTVYYMSRPFTNGLIKNI